MGMKKSFLVKSRIFYGRITIFVEIKIYDRIKINTK